MTCRSAGSTEKPELLRALSERATTAIKEGLDNSGRGALTARTRSRAFTRALTHYKKVTTPNPTRPGQRAGSWTWRELRPGAAKDLAERIRAALTKEVTHES